MNNNEIVIKIVDYCNKTHTTTKPYLCKFIDNSKINVRFAEENENDNIDIIISFSFYDDYKKYKNAIKIQHINSEKHFYPKFDEFQYVIGDINGTLNNTKYSCYLPAWLWQYSIFDNYNIDLIKQWTSLTDEQLLNRKFCCFLGKLENRIHRKNFIECLSKYKMVDSISDGKPQADKLPNDKGQITKINWIRNYKFNITFENGDKIGYITEKAVDPFYGNTASIYFGNLMTFNKDFNWDQTLIINEKTYEQVIDRIVYLDNNPNEYLKLMKTQILKRNVIENYKQSFTSFLLDIIK